MASLRLKPNSPYYFACYQSADGRRTQRSTKQSNRKTAQAIADAWERAAKLGAEKRLGETQARQIMAEIFKAVNNEELPSATTKDFLAKWAERRKTDTAPRTYQAYSQVIRDFLESLGNRAERDISMVSKADVARYRDSVLDRTSVATANKTLKYLRVALGAAYKDGLTQDNPAARLDVLKRRDEEHVDRRAFTVTEIKLILKHASHEWKGLILFGLYTGQRLNDLARLTWQNIDLTEKKVRFVTGKTNREMDLPLRSEIIAYLGTIKGAKTPTDALFPNSFTIATNSTGDSRLSQQFHSILVDAKLATERTKAATGKGRRHKRRISEISFHSLRHSATSLLKKAGVHDSVAMDIIGHDSKAISRHYTHVDDESKRQAIDKLPDLTENL